MRLARAAGGALGAVLLAACAHAQTGYPMVTSVYPVGIRRGASTEITISGQQNFAGAYGALFEGPGLTAEVAPTDAAKPVNEVNLKITATADARLGPQEIRVATPRGLSSIGMLFVDSEPQLQEKEPNNAPAEATPVELPATLNGRIGSAEDVDSYRLTVNAGDEVAFNCLSARLQDKFHDLSPGSGGTHSDPILSLTDETGREIAAADDYYGPDPLLVHRFEKAGVYILQIRDVRYNGSPTWTYCLTCTRDPYLLGTYPMAGKRGESVQVTPIGFNLGGMREARVEVPMRDPGPMDVQLRAGEKTTNPVAFVVSDQAQVLESPDNDGFEKATPAQLPCGLNGRIEAENDVDCFRFPGKKGTTYTFAVLARRFGSSLDSFIRIIDPKGADLGSSDDSDGKDSRLDWTCPADGEYALQVSDLHSRGGASYVYTVAATVAEPDFVLRCDDDKALVAPGAGCGYCMYVQVERRYGFAGEVKLTAEGLPSGVTFTGDRIPASMTQVAAIFQAAPETKPAFGRIRMFGTAEVKLADGSTKTLKREVIPQEEIYMPGGGRSVYPVATHAVSVTDSSDVLLKLSATKVDLQPGGTVAIDVDVVRQKEYKGNVVLDVYLRHLGSVYGNPLPPGVRLDENASKTLLGPADTKGKIVLKAAADAQPVESLPIAILGQVSINFVVKVSHASEPVLLTLKK
jgi:hypothetical protein